MKINLKRLNDQYHFVAQNETGNEIHLDSSPDIGGENNGMRPMQLLLAAVGGCSAIDVILILKKQKQEITSFDVEIKGEKEQIDTYSLFRNITLIFTIGGNVDYDKAERAIQLSLEKYCSVAKTLEPTAKIGYELIVNC